MNIKSYCVQQLKRKLLLPFIIFEQKTVTISWNQDDKLCVYSSISDKAFLINLRQNVLNNCKLHGSLISLKSVWITAIKQTLK